eukprot:m.165882 g.165882  ORF g.165882 m.165882 type:complete len:352 (-) comp31402_c0_seq1:194-1249(-)
MSSTQLKRTLVTPEHIQHLKDCLASGNVGSSGELLWLEHVNLVVDNDLKSEKSGNTMIQLFYFEGLGLTSDPAKSFGNTVWANVGDQQFHLVKGTAEETPQVIHGLIGLVLPDLDALLARLAKIEAEINTTLFHYEGCKDSTTGKLTSVKATCPFGNQFLIQSSSSFTHDEKVDHTKPEGEMVLERAHKNQHYEMNVRGGAGIKFVEFWVGTGMAKKIGEFYTFVFGCKPQACGTSVVVSAGQGVSLIFSEKGWYDEDVKAKQDGVHICVYMHKFEETFDKMEANKLNWTNPRFVYLDRCDTKSEAVACKQFRVKDVITDGKVSTEKWELEHEVRCTSHKQFLKRVVYNPC